MEVESTNETQKPVKIDLNNEVDYALLHIAYIQEIVRKSFNRTRKPVEKDKHRGALLFLNTMREDLEAIHNQAKEQANDKLDQKDAETTETKTK